MPNILLLISFASEPLISRQLSVASAKVYHYLPSEASRREHTHSEA